MNPNDNPHGQHPFPHSPSYGYGEAPPQAAPQPMFAQASAPLHAPFTDTRARNAGIAILASAAVLLIGVVARSWFTSRGDGTLSLLGLEECRRGLCETMNWFDIKRAPDELKLFSALGLLGGLVAIGFMIHAGVVLLKNTASRVNLIGLNISLGIAAFGCVSFWLQLGFGELSGKLSMGWAGFFAIGAIIAAGVIIPAWIRPLTRATRPLGPLSR